MYPQAIKIL